jgi:RNA polymerase sigma factor (sigma-70 family)
MTRYLLAVNFDGGVVDTPMEEWKPEEITAHLDHYRALRKELVASGERVGSEVLTGPDLAKIVTADGVSAPRWALPGVQGVAGRLSDRGRGVRGARDRDRREDLGGAWSGRSPVAAADPGAAGYGRVTVRRRRDGGVAPAGRWRALNVPLGVEDLLREVAQQVLGALARRYGDFDAAEDAVQEALITAAAHWAQRGVPAHPRGWLMRTAERRLIDQWRSERSRRERERRAMLQDAATRQVSDQDDTLTVVFMCCHPALTPASAIALTLRAVGGLTTAEIANAFLVDEATMAQRISRASRRLVCPFGCRHPRSSPRECGRCCTCST